MRSNAPGDDADRQLFQSIPGLCRTCLHAQPVTNPRGSVFLLCQAYKINPQMQRYPRLPVMDCPEFMIFRE